MKYAWLLALALVGCGGQGLRVDNGGPRKVQYTNHASDPNVVYELPVPVYVTPDFSPIEREAIDEGLGEWNIVLNGYETLVVVTDDNRAALLKSSLGIAVQNDPADDVEDEVLAFTQVGGPNFGIVHMIPARIGTRDFKGVFMHEMGHALGLEHVPMRSSLLYPSYQADVHCIDHDTVRALADLHRTWSLNHLNWCE